MQQTKGIKVLVVDDEPNIVQFLTMGLANEGYQVYSASDGAAGLESLKAHAPHIVILDVMMPGMDGFEVCQRMKEIQPVSVIMLTAREETENRVRGLHIGADDYISKPFELEEVLSRVKAHLRRERRWRVMRKPSDTGLSFDNGALTIDKDTYEAYYRQTRIDLSTKEFQIFSFLAEHSGRVVSREQLYEAVWGEQEAGDIHTVTVHIKNLRAKLWEANGYIKTVWGSGYMFVGERDPAYVEDVEQE